MTLSRFAPLAAVFVLASVTDSSLTSAQTGTSGTKMAASATKQPPLSPRDSLKVTIGTASISVNYGRPSKRGRDIFGALNDMKWGMVWRMGANEATAFSTSKPLQFGASTVPAGNYTLWVQLEQSGKWQLIVNKQTGQWGTAYDASQDLVRVPMSVTALATVVEQMEITVKPAAKGGELAVAWDKTRASAAFTVK